MVSAAPTAAGDHRAVATRALITGVAGASLSADERAFLRSARPCGLILFARNCVDPPQIRALIASALDAIGSDEVLVLIDQEGGRVQRLRPPLGRALPAASAYAHLSKTDPEAACASAFSAARLVAADLRDLGINTNCAPVLDLRFPGAHQIIGDRAYGSEPSQIVALGQAVAEGYMSGGVVPVIKHIPGHGRATADSHHELPVVSTPRDELEATDFAPFRALAALPAAMTAHVVYADIDASAPATTSHRVIESIIREHIGFGGLLMSDDLSMKALSGSIRSLAEASIAAGCDVALHCNGDLAEMHLAAEGTLLLTGRAGERFTSAFEVTRSVAPFDIAALEAALGRVLDVAGAPRESV